MPNLRDIRRRINSVKNTQQITRAMKMVAAARLRRAQENVWAARPYADTLMKLMVNLASRSNGDEHPLLPRREIKRALYIVMTTDRGLCGALNANILRGVVNSLEMRKEVEPSLIVIGKKGRDFFRRLKRYNVIREYVQFDKEPLEHSDEIGEFITRSYVAEEYDQVLLIYNRFRSTLSQVVAEDQLLPIHRVEVSQEEGAVEFLYEPSMREVLEHIMHKYVINLIYTAFIDSVASEQASRMTAMDNATKNASELIDHLTLMYNRARQAAITKEIIEVVSGADALKG